MSPRWPGESPFKYRTRHELPDLGETGGLGGDEQGVSEVDWADVGEMMGLENLTRTTLTQAARQDRIPGGPADDMGLEDFDPEALLRGMTDELEEHGGDLDQAFEIASDHLVKDPGAYPAKKKKGAVEDEDEDEPEDECPLCGGDHEGRFCEEAFCARCRENLENCDCDDPMEIDAEEFLELARTSPKKQGSNLPSGFEGFDADDLFGAQDEPEASNPQRDLEAAIGMGYGSLVDATPLLRDKSLLPLIGGAIRHYGQGSQGAWSVHVESAKDEAEAVRVARRVQKALVGRRNLTASDPSMHGRSFFVTYPGGYAEVSPRKVESMRAKRSSNASDDAAIAKGNEDTLCSPETKKLTSEPIWKQKGGIGAIKRSALAAIRKGSQRDRRPGALLTRPVEARLERHFDRFVQARSAGAHAWLLRERGIGAVQGKTASIAVRAALRDADLRESLKDRYWNDFVLRIANNNPQQDVSQVPTGLLEEILYDMEEIEERRPPSASEETTKNLSEEELTERRKVTPLKKKQSAAAPLSGTAERILAEMIGSDAPKTATRRKVSASMQAAADRDLLVGGYENFTLGATKTAMEVDLDLDLFSDEEYAQADRTLAAITVQRLQEERPRMLTRPHELVTAAANMFPKMARRFRGYTIEEKHLERIQADKLASDGRCIIGRLVWNVRLADHFGRRRASVTVVQPVINGEPCEQFTLLSAAGREIPFTREALDRVIGIRRDSTALSRGNSEVPLSHVYEK